MGKSKRSHSASHSASHSGSRPANDPVFKPVEYYDRILQEINLDEERLLANLAFSPVIAGKQLRAKHFGITDFQGLEGNRVLLGAMLASIEEEESLNLPNLLKRLNDEQKGGKPKIDWVGGRDRVYRLFSSPFTTPGVSLLEDLDPLIDSIRDRNVRVHARRTLQEYSEKVNRENEDAFEMISSCIQELRTLFLQGSTGYIRNLDVHLNEMRELVQDNRIKKRGYLGFNSNFPILQEKLNGIQKDYYLITGGVGMGKTSFATQLAWDLVNMNSDLSVLYFTLDLNRIDISAKLVAQAEEVPIDYVKNPYVTNIDFEKKRQEGISKVSAIRDSFYIIAESNGRIFLDDIKKLVKRTKLERSGDVAVKIDPIFKIHLKHENLSFNEKCNMLSAELKSLSAAEGVTLIVTAGLPKAISNRRPVREDLEEIMGFLYDPYVIFFIYCDYLNDFETPFLEWQWGKDNFLIPISEIFIGKNKMGGINSRIFYRFFESYSKFKECAPQEVENYSAMIENLQKYKEDKVLKTRAMQKNKIPREEEF